MYWVLCPRVLSPEIWLIHLLPEQQPIKQLRAPYLFFSTDLGHLSFAACPDSFFFFFNFIYLFLAVLGLPCCTQAFSSCGEWGLLFIAVRGLLITVASLAVEQGL